MRLSSAPKCYQLQSVPLKQNAEAVAILWKVEGCVNSYRIIQFHQASLTQ